LERERNNLSDHHGKQILCNVVRRGQGKMMSFVSSLGFANDFWIWIWIGFDLIFFFLDWDLVPDSG
jgi:hypothetical protein